VSERRDRLDGKHILLGVSGSIAAYKAVELLRGLQEKGADVSVSLTRNAARFVTPLTFETLSGKPVLGDGPPEEAWSGIRHVDVTEGLDLALIAPATANIIGKIASGIADDALTTALTAIECPLIIAPAMNDRMYRNAMVQKNIAFLKEQGVRFVDPDTGPLACGAIGQGRLADLERIMQVVSSTLSKGDLSGVTVLVTAGPTREPIDAVRFISNPSTGRMGYALAAAARDRGATVILVTGITAIAPPRGVTLIPVRTASDMRKAVMDRVSGAEVVIMAAAVSDFRPAVSSDRKIKKQDAPLVINLERTEDILSDIGHLPGSRLVVGFAAETDNVLDNALKKLKTKNLDMIVANDLTRMGAGFGADTNAVTVIDRSGMQTEFPVMPKPEIARRIIDKITELMANKRILP
jgi:phosphopantothenoylcysteine decarboxylase/phosphopantothenate--cysteine ligase